jgi:hypothetical protein
MIYKTLHRNLKINQREHHYKPEVNSCAPEGVAVAASKWHPSFQPRPYRASLEFDSSATTSRPVSRRDCAPQIRVITKLPNSDQSYKEKVVLLLVQFWDLRNKLENINIDVRIRTINTNKYHNNPGV